MTPIQRTFHPSLGRYVYLGKKPARHDAHNRTLRIVKYLPRDLVAPSTWNWEKIVSHSGWPMMLNDAEGDCTIAACGHMEMAWTANELGLSKMVTPTDDQIQTMYSGVSGYIPGDPSTDVGADPLTVMNYWRQHGLGGRKIDIFGSVNPWLLADLKLVVYALGGAYIGVQLPITAKNQASVWSVPGGLQGAGAPGSWGGHAIPILAYTTLSTGKLFFWVVSWGQIFGMTEYFLRCYCDEAWGVVSPDFFSTGKNPIGIDIAQAQADLALVTS